MYIELLFSYYILYIYVYIFVHSFIHSTSDLQDCLSCVARTASLRGSCVSLVTRSAQRSGGHPLGRRHDEGQNVDGLGAGL